MRGTSRKHTQPSSSSTHYLIIHALSAVRAWRLFVRAALQYSCPQLGRLLLSRLAWFGFRVAWFECGLVSVWLLQCPEPWSAGCAFRLCCCRLHVFWCSCGYHVLLRCHCCGARHSVLCLSCTPVASTKFPHSACSTAAHQVSAAVFTSSGRILTVPLLLLRGSGHDRRKSGNASSGALSPCVHTIATTAGNLHCCGRLLCRFVPALPPHACAHLPAWCFYAWAPASEPAFHFHCFVVLGAASFLRNAGPIALASIRACLPADCCPC